MRAATVFWGVTHGLATCLQSKEEKLKRKAAGVPLFKERKRKLFIHDETVRVNMEWDKIKRRKMSMFSHVNRAMSPNDIDPIVELYAVGKTVGDDGESDDMLILIPIFCFHPEQLSLCLEKNRKT